VFFAPGRACRGLLYSWEGAGASVLRRESRNIYWSSLEQYILIWKLVAVAWSGHPGRIERLELEPGRFPDVPPPVRGVASVSWWPVNYKAGPEEAPRLWPREGGSSTTADALRPRIWPVNSAG